jgi:IstB-like ATP binding protein
VSTAPLPLAADLTAGLRRLKLAAMRRLAPELLVTAKTQRWSPEEFLRTLVQTEISSRDESNARTRMKQAAFPVTKTLAEFDLASSSIPAATFDYLASLEWIRAAENACLIGPAGTGKSHVLVALGVAAVQAGHRVRYLTAAELVETLYRALAGNSVGRVIDTPAPQRPDHLRRARLRPARRHRRPAAVPVHRRRLRTPLARHRLTLAVRILRPVPARAHHRGQPARPAAAPLPRRHHRRRLLPDETSPSPRRWHPQNQLNNPEERGLLTGHQRGLQPGR